MTSEQKRWLLELRDILDTAEKYDTPELWGFVELMAGAVDGKALLSQQALARALGVTARHVRDLAAERKIPEVRVGDSPRYVLSDVLAALGRAH